MTDSFAWSSEYETGNQMVDREHKELLRLVSLIMMVDRKQAEDERKQTFEVQLAALKRYVDQHFNNEENMLAAAGSSFLGKQRLLHNTLRSELNAISKYDRDGPSGETAGKIATWSRDHLLDHFMNADKRAFEAANFAN